MRQISFDLPSQIQIAQALASMPRGEHQETVRRMAVALDLLREGGWALVPSTPQEQNSLEAGQGPGLPP